MARIRRHDRSFGGLPAGEWCEVPDADVPYLVETYDVEVEGAEIPAPKPVPAPQPRPEVPANTDKPETPSKRTARATGSGWYQIDGDESGQSYRRKQLPPDVEIV
jgi:hypothetical protein